MEGNFDYEDVFMGVMEGKQKSYLRTFKDDYRLKLLTKAVPKETGKILDIGCGGGITTESLAYYYPKATLFGCDVSKQAIDYAKKFGSGKVSYGVIKDKKLPYKNDTFDLCVCLDVMEHVPDVEFFLKEVKRILKNNGKFYLLVPCEGQPGTMTWMFQKIKKGHKWTFKRWGHIHPEFTHKYVKDLLAAHGFTAKKVTYSEHAIFQLLTLILYFIPLELMDSLLGKKAKRYTDSGVIKAMKTKKKRIDPMLIWRNSWLGLTNGLRYITSWELDVMQNSGISGWKIQVLSEVKKKEK